MTRRRTSNRNPGERFRDHRRLNDTDEVVPEEVLYNIIDPNEFVEVDEEDLVPVEVQQDHLDFRDDDSFERERLFELNAMGNGVGFEPFIDEDISQFENQWNREFAAHRIGRNYRQVRAYRGFRESMRRHRAANRINRAYRRMRQNRLDRLTNDYRFIRNNFWRK